MKSLENLSSIDLKKFPEQVDRVLAGLRGAGYAAYAVGGCVRDWLRGVEPKDYDVATAALPDQVEAVFADAGARVIPTGAKHGTVTVLLDGLPVEVTTFRVDGVYSDGRRPDAVTFTASLTEDLSRRDFTINAMACGPDGVLVDLFGGRADLEAGVVRCVGVPDVRFREDALRILRALRFSSVLGFRVEGETAAALRRCKELMRKISAERVAEELQKLLCGGDVRRVLMEYTDVLGITLPELLPMQGFQQRSKYHIYDVLEHTAAAVEQTPPDPVLRWAALFHDSGKPACFALDAEGAGHFFGHPKECARIADEVLRRLRLDNETRDRIVLLVEQHDRWIEPSETAVRRALHRLGPEAFIQLIALKRADNLAQAPEYHRERQRTYDELERIAAEILEQGACFSLKDLAVRGGDLIAAGMTPGPALGGALDALLSAVIDGTLPNEKNALMDYLRREGRL